MERHRGERVKKANKRNEYTLYPKVEKSPHLNADITMYLEGYKKTPYAMKWSDA